MSRLTTRQGRSPGRKFDRTRRAAARRFLPFPELLESYQLLTPTVFNVTNTSDFGNSGSTAGDGTLRSAIDSANALGVGGSAIINFQIPGTGLHTITLFADEALPTLVVPTFIDGYSQIGNGYVGAPVIEINGATDPGGNGITLGGNGDTNASGSEIVGLAIVNFLEAGPPSGAVVSGAGIDVTAQAGDTVISGCYVGIAANGVTPAANDYGITVSSSGNTIGGQGGNGDNVISGNLTGGITVFGQLNLAILAPALDNLIQGNDIGTNATGTNAVPNGITPNTTVNGAPGAGYGIGLAGASDTTIGGTALGAGNIISGNSGYGIDMTQFVGDISGFDNTSDQEVPTTDNLVEGNLIGTTASGASALPNNIGIVMAGAASNTIGGTAPKQANVISGNGSGVVGALASGIGVAIVGANATADVLEGNFIGTTVTNGNGINFPIPNSSDGVFVGGPSGFLTSAAGVASGTTIGGPANGASNVISDNTGSGVYFDGTSTADSVGDLVQGNSIESNGLFGIRAQYVSGLDVFASIIADNGSEGILVFDGTGTAIGGYAPGATNNIQGNTGDGIEISANNTTTASLASLIGNNIGGNHLDGIQVTGGIVTVTIQRNTILGNTADGIEIDQESNATIGGTSNSASNSISGNKADGISIVGNTPSLPSTGDLIENNQIGVSVGDVVVNPGTGGTAGPDLALGDGNADDGISALNTSGLTVLGNTIEFNGVGVEISDSIGTTIGGSQSGASNNIISNNGDGVDLFGLSSPLSTGDLVADNLIGVLPGNGGLAGNQGHGILASDTNGLLIVGNTIEGGGGGGGLGGDGIGPNILFPGAVEIDHSTGTSIGGTTPAAVNVISNNAGFGLLVDYVKGLSVIDNTIETNTQSGILGHGFSGSSALFSDNIIETNTGFGIYLSGSSVTLNIEGNTIEHNSRSGLRIDPSSSSDSGTSSRSGSPFAANISGNTSSNNGAGIFVADGIVTVTIQGNTVENNTASGIYIGDESNATIGGTTPAEANIIAGNPGGGINIIGDSAAAPSTGDLVEGNQIGVLPGGVADGNRNGIEGYFTSGLMVLGNTDDNNYLGIDLSESKGATIGGTALGADNVISDNTHAGVFMAGVNGLSFVDNTVNTNDGGGVVYSRATSGTATFTGDTISSNHFAGIFISRSSVTLSFEHNDIEGNSHDGITISASNTKAAFPANFIDNTILNNGGAGIYVSGGIVTATVQGNDVQGNSLGGVVIDYESNATIGGSTTVLGNTIAGNAASGGDGIYLEGTELNPSTGDVIEGNLIGVLSAGGTPSSATGNLEAGIYADSAPGLVIAANTIEENAYDGIDVASSAGVTIGGSTRGAGNTISANKGSGIDVEDSTDDLVQDNIVGNLAGGAPAGNGMDGITFDDATDALVVGNTVEHNGSVYHPPDVANPDGKGGVEGAIAAGSSTGITIGGTANGAANIISHNLIPGIGLDDVGGPVVVGNTIDTNSGSGISGQSFSTSPALFADNMIEHNAGGGIFLGGSTVTLTVQDNHIESNGSSGLAITARSATHFNPASSAFAANVLGNTISDNTGIGIYVSGGAVTVAIQDNVVAGNTGIGIDCDEAHASIGGTALNAGNSITGNVGDGIELGGRVNRGDASVEQNTITGNHGAGVEVTNSSDNTIGGTAADAANIIASNTGAGVAIDVPVTTLVSVIDPSVGTLISGNSISQNGALGIDLDFGGPFSGIPLPNDSGIANNNGQNYPVLTGVGVTEAGTTVTGTLSSTPDKTFTIEFFANSTADPSGYGQGQTYLTSTIVTTNGTGAANFSVPLGLSVPIGTIISTTATDSTNDTSEFSLNSTAVATTTTTLTSSANPSVLGQTVTFTATVVVIAPGTAAPGGTVDFYDGATLLNVTPVALSLVDGQYVATFATAALPLNYPTGDSITAVYSGDVNTLTSTSSALSEVVNPYSTTTSLTSSLNPSLAGQSVTFTATVSVDSPGAGTPGGTVNFYDGTTLLNATPASLSLVDGHYVATFATAGLPANSAPGDSITAVYSGDSSGLTSTSSTLFQSVEPAIILSPSTLPTPTVGNFYSQQLTATGGSGSGYVFASGTLPPGLTLSAGGLLSGTPTTVSGVVVTVDVTATDGEGGTGNMSYVLTVKDLTEAGGIVSSLPQSFYGETVVLTATFTATLGTAPMTGTVAFYDGTTYLGTAPLIDSGDPSGTASLPTSALTVGNHVITAIYSGDVNYTGATSEFPVSVLVVPATTSTSFSSTTSPQGTTLTADVVVTSPGNPPIGGTVSFYDNGTLLGTAPVTGGVATLNVSSLPAGAQALSAVYSGTATLAGSSSPVAPTDGPLVTDVARYGFHDQATYLLLSFNGPLDLASAQNALNYKIVAPDGRRIAVASAIYDSATDTVTLLPSERLNIHRRYRLTVNGTADPGVMNPAGVLLDGANNGKPGSNFVASLTWRNLAGRASTLPTLGLVDAARQQAVRAQTALRHAEAKLHGAAVDHVLAQISLHGSSHHAKR
jgi:Bacterial Ig-like domain (group 3)/Right handed beta helix region/Periplasmic copper-binding protein (NosD)